MDNKLSTEKRWWSVTYKSKVDTGEGVKEWISETHRVYATYRDAVGKAISRHMRPLGEKVLFHVSEAR